MSSKVTRKQAEKVVAAIHAAFPSYTKDFAIGADGRRDLDAPLVPVTNPEYLPVLLEDWDGHDFAIAWETGSPYDWTYSFPFGGSDEEFGGSIKDVSAKIPAGVHVEAVNNCVVALYRD